ncbi:MAG: transketolase family protein [Deltaproteobacteria bacterium]
MRKRFKQTVTELAARDERIVLLFGDVSVYLFNDFKEAHPRRFYNVGICENAIISAGAGLSAMGLIPVMHTITPFITERSYEQIKIDLCYNRFGGNILTCGASFDYAWDGATHHAYTDLAILRLLPGMEVIQPGSEKELDVLFRSQYANGKPTYFRLSDHPHAVDIDPVFGRAVVLKDAGADVTVMTAGPLLGNVLEACRDLAVNLVYFHTIKPIDREAIRRFRHTEIVVVHDAFGLQEAIAEEPGLKMAHRGLPDEFLCCYGKLPDVRREIGLDPASIREFLKKRTERNND